MTTREQYAQPIIRDRDQEGLPDVTVAVPVIERTSRLVDLLESLRTISPAAVVVADNGDTATRRHVYDTEWPFDLEVLDLPFDCGIGQCRHRSAAAADTEYVLVVDNDMLVPANVEWLVDALRTDPALGAVGGILEEHGHLRAGACNLHEETLVDGRTALVQSIRESPTVEHVGHVPIARFDKLANAMVVRRQCIEDYSWDPELHDKEHLDWFVGHRETGWEFAVSPAVIVPHRPSRQSSYVEKYRHENEERQAAATERFCRKWGYDEVVWGRTRWFGTAERSLPERLYKAVEPSVPTKLLHPVKREVAKVFE